MMLHPHLHCIIPGGGISISGEWKTTRSKGKYLFPVKAMAEVYRAVFMKLLTEKAALDVFDLSIELREKIYKKRWVVYAKRPFASPIQIIEYLAGPLNYSQSRLYSSDHTF